jgi:predicted nucleic acid-binding protein
LTSVPIVIADSSPINYLVLIGHIDVLPVLFDKVILPTVVQIELQRPKAPPAVRRWIANAPAWLEVRPSPSEFDPSLADLDDGERAAIALAMELKANLLLIDERRGTRTARSKGFRVAGTLAVLGLAARRDLLVLADAFERLKRTSFRYSQKLLDQFLAEQSGNV